MDQRICHQLANGKFGKQRLLLPKRRPDMLIGRQEAVDIADQSLKSGRIALLAIVPVGDRIGLAPAAIGNKADALSGQD